HETFDKIFILNLHGSYKKKEKSPDGSSDENVFDIQQGVNISFFIKKSGNEKKQVKYFDLYGKRNSKYRKLNDSTINSINWENLELKEPNFFFVAKDFKNFELYRSGIELNKLFKKYKSGV